MQSDLEGPVNIGSPEYVSVAQLVDVVAGTAGKRVAVRYVAGPVGVRSRNFSNARVYSLGWQARFSLEAGIGRTYPWVAEQVRRGRAEDRLPQSTPTPTEAR
jgi:nucleoside-diphosphate-sugar epimerase